MILNIEWEMKGIFWLYMGLAVTLVKETAVFALPTQN
jgi:hypothetical protein